MNLMAHYFLNIVRNSAHKKLLLIPLVQKLSTIDIQNFLRNLYLVCLTWKLIKVTINFIFSKTLQKK